MLDKGYGYQNISSKKKAMQNTMYLIGSAQKFTTGLILKHLELSNKININDPVTKYLPWFKTNKTITLKDLMLHRSGLYKFSANPNTKSLDGAVHDIQEERLIVNIIISIYITMLTISSSCASYRSSNASFLCGKLL